MNKQDKQASEVNRHKQTKKADAFTFFFEQLRALKSLRGSGGLLGDGGAGVVVACALEEEDIIPKNMRHPRLSPAWLKHEKQVLRWYGFFQEIMPHGVLDGENSRTDCSENDL